jgi:uncharacterized protein (TIGR02145 family)
MIAIQWYRRYLLFAAFFILSGTCLSQDITLTFTSIYQNNHWPVDSVLVENLTHPADTVLYPPDTILVLRSAMGVEPPADPSQNGFSVCHPSPNPSDGPSSVEFLWFTTAGCFITVVNANGQTLYSGQKLLSPGRYQFTVENGIEKLLIIAISSLEKSVPVKMLRKPDPAHRPARFTIRPVNGMGMDAPEGVAASPFRFYPSDSLRCVAYASSGSVPASDVVSVVPQDDDTLEFHLLEGTPCHGEPSLLYGGQVYRTVRIGLQCWMKENLNIGIRVDYPATQTNNGVVEKYCYQNLDIHCEAYGGLYQWGEMMNTQGDTVLTERGICPPGWHIPSENEWLQLADAWGGYDSAAQSLKTVGTQWWDPPNDGTNYSGFSARAGGYCDEYLGFSSRGYVAEYWTSTSDWSQHDPVKMKYMFGPFPTLYTASTSTKQAVSVRCVK